MSIKLSILYYLISIYYLCKQGSYLWFVDAKQLCTKNSCEHKIKVNEQNGRNKKKDYSLKQNHCNLWTHTEHFYNLKVSMYGPNAACCIESRKYISLVFGFIICKMHVQCCKISKWIKFNSTLFSTH